MLILQSFEANIKNLDILFKMTVVFSLIMLYSNAVKQPQQNLSMRGHYEEKIGN